MIKIPRLCGDLFADPERTLEALSAGLRDHQTRLTGYPHSGAFDGILATTNEVVGRWNALELTINTGQRTQQVGRVATQADRETALKRIQRNFAAINALEDDDARDRLLKLFYSKGIEQYTDEKLDSLDPLFDTYLDLLDHPEATGLPDGFAVRTTADLSIFEGTRGEQIGQQAITTRARLQRQAMVPEVTGLLTDNYHFLCLHFSKERSLVASFFNRRHLEVDSAEDAEAADDTPTPDAPAAPTGN